MRQSFGADVRRMASWLVLKNEASPHAYSTHYSYPHSSAWTEQRTLNPWVDGFKSLWGYFADQQRDHGDTGVCTVVGKFSTWASDGNW